MSSALIFPLLVVVAIVVVWGGVAFLGFGQKLKGDLEIDLGNPRLGPGRDIAGVLAVTAKKPLGPGRLSVSLVCIEEWYESRTDANGIRSRDRKTEEVYRHDIDLAAGLTVPRGRRHVAPFVLPTPQPQDTVAEDPDRSGLSRAMDFLADALTPDREHIWSIEGRFRIKGLDLTEEARIPLNYGSNF